MRDCSRRIGCLFFVRRFLADDFDTRGGLFFFGCLYHREYLISLRFFCVSFVFLLFGRFKCWIAGGVEGDEAKIWQDTLLCEWNLEVRIMSKAFIFQRKSEISLWWCG